MDVYQLHNLLFLGTTKAINEQNWYHYNQYRYFSTSAEILRSEKQMIAWDLFSI